MESSMEKEIWKDIPDYEGLYQVSSEGRVKSLERHVRHWKGGSQLIRERYLTTRRGIRGYSIVSLAKNGKSKTQAVHVLVAIVFLNHVPCGHGVIVDHIENDKSDNRLINLQLISQRENTTKDRKPSSGFTGVYKRKSGRYKSEIFNKRYKKSIYLGTFDTPEEAHEAYLKKLKEIENLNKD